MLQFAKKQIRKEPSKLAVEEIDAPLICAFLDEEEATRGISARSRNLRLTAIRSLFRYTAYELRDYAEQIQHILAIPGKNILILRSAI